MSPTPWNSIAESVVEQEQQQLSYSESLKSPCLSCQTSPCCTYLPLHTFQIQNILELDHAIYLLNFDRIELGLSATGEWSVYYRYPCRFLDQKEFICTIHNTSSQPQICVNYNPYRCWYKRVLTKSVSDEFLRIDRQRMEYIVSLLTFDEAGNITDIPTWENLISGISQLPLEAPSIERPVQEFAPDLGKQLSPNANFTEVETKPLKYDAAYNPCNSCEAHCCKTLVFPHPIPRSMSNFDYLKFCLGFPGIELGIANDTWSIVVKTTCRHLQNNRCLLYGQPQRPLICKYYDAWKCTYKTNFGLLKPEGFMRLKLEQFDALMTCFQFDDYHNITRFVPAEEIRLLIEQSAGAEISFSQT